ncbi:MAG TPA: pectinesterase family protein [Nitrospira sp.]|nr:pectinesterase family protein [Nitrospira sp.]
MGNIIILCLSLASMWLSPLWADEGISTEPQQIVVALDGSGRFRSIQEAVDAAKKGDTIFIQPGAYSEDVTIHSKENIRLIGAGMDQVTLLGRERVGVFHVGKWPYGATDIEISGLTINEHGGHAMGIFNGRGIVLHHVRVKGMLFTQQVEDVRIENCIIGGSETTGVQFANSQAVLRENFIHDNDHGVSVAGKSSIRLERNIITKSLFEAVIVNDQSRAVMVGNTLVKNGGGAAFLGASQSEASGNIVSFNRYGFVVGPSTRVALSFNAMQNSESNYLRPGPPPQPAPELKPDSDLTVDPRFVDSASDDFRLRADTTLVKIGQFSFLGALPPIAESH